MPEENLSKEDMKDVLFILADDVIKDILENKKKESKVINFFAQYCKRKKGEEKVITTVRALLKGLRDAETIDKEQLNRLLDNVAINCVVAPGNIIRVR